MLEALRSLQQRGLQPKNLANLILTAPDLNIVRFQQIMPSVITIPVRATLYASSRDRALRASRRWHDYQRAGEGGVKLPLLPGMDSIDVTSVDTSFIGHAYFGDNKSVVSDLYDLIANDSPPADRICLSARGQVPRQYWIFDRWKP